MDLNPPVLSLRRFPSAVDKSSEVYLKNFERWKDLIQTFRERLDECTSQGENKYIERHIRRGLLLGKEYPVPFLIGLARDRISLLLDEDSPFLELNVFAGYNLDDGTYSASQVAGIGLVNGVMCMVTAHIPTLDGGAWKPISTVKTKRVCRIAAENDLPMISMVQSAGVSLPHQFRVFHSGGELFKDIARRSAQGTPTCAVVLGSSTAGGAYQPGMSDYTILVKNQAQVFLGGPPLVKMATGEITDAESLGGADMHSRESGLSDQLAIDEFEAILKARQWVLTINRNTKPPKLGLVLPPFYDPEELLGIVSADIRHPFDMQEVIARIVDDSRVEVFKPLYGKNLVTCWAYIHGFPIGIIGNQNPVILSHDAHKGTQFIRLCNNSNTPIIFLHNVSGFMVGKKTEKEGLIKAGSLFVNAVSNSKVPHISIICGASYGAGNYAMCGRPYDPRFLFSWPNSRCSVMGAEQLTGVMEHIAREGAAKSGRKIDEEALGKRSEGFRKRVEADGDVYYTSAHMLDDGIIDPRDTRNVLGICLDIVHNTESFRDDTLTPRMSHQNGRIDQHWNDPKSSLFSPIPGDSSTSKQSELASRLLSYMKKRNIPDIPQQRVCQYLIPLLHREELNEVQHVAVERIVGLIERGEMVKARQQVLSLMQGDTACVRWASSLRAITDGNGRLS